ncbi:unnamed protein product [Merluccius merluccius]
MSVKVKHDFRFPQGFLESSGQDQSGPDGAMLPPTTPPEGGRPKTSSYHTNREKKPRRDHIVPHLHLDPTRVTTTRVH